MKADLVSGESPVPHNDELYVPLGSGPRAALRLFIKGMCHLSERRSHDLITS